MNTTTRKIYLKVGRKRARTGKMDMNPPVKWIKNGKGHGKRPSKPTKEKRRKKSRIRRIIEKKIENSIKNFIKKLQFIFQNKKITLY